MVLSSIDPGSAVKMRGIGSRLFVNPTKPDQEGESNTSILTWYKRPPMTSTEYNVEISKIKRKKVFRRLTLIF